MGNVKGPFDRSDFLLMLMLKQSIKFMKTKDRELYSSAIEKEEKILKQTMSREAA